MVCILQVVVIGHLCPHSSPAPQLPPCSATAALAMVLLPRKRLAQQLESSSAARSKDDIIGIGIGAEVSEDKIPCTLNSSGCRQAARTVTVRVTIDMRGQRGQIGIQLALGVERGACMVQVGYSWGVKGQPTEHVSGTIFIQVCLGEHFMNDYWYRLLLWKCYCS